MSSPWGAIQQSTTIISGVRWVSTAGHGGYMVASRWALEHLSEAARDGALRYGDYYCYEEDCDYAIVEWESPEVRAKQIARHNEWIAHTGKPLHTEASWLAGLRLSLQRWNPAYLAAFEQERRAA